MIEPSLFILYVDSPLNSAEFYSRLLGKPPLDASATFAMFALDSGIKLALWSKHTVEPSSQLTGGGHELAFALADHTAVDAKHQSWQQQGLPILQAPTQMDFGYTFVALDPDQHRLRVFTMSE